MPEQSNQLWMLLVGISDHAMELFQFMVTVAMIIAAYYMGMAKGSRITNEKQRHGRKTFVSDTDMEQYQELSSLKSQIEELNSLNTRYLTFTQSLSDVVKRLYSSLSASEISSTIVKFVIDVINTDTVELYLFDPQENLLRGVNTSANTANKKTTYRMGERLIGSTARDGFMKISSVNYDGAQSGSSGGEAGKFSMVTPIKFNNRLIGVLGVGNIQRPTGNKRHLVRSICDIAA